MRIPRYLTIVFNGIVLAGLVTADTPALLEISTKRSDSTI
jgi:hypothetical protein